MTEPYLIHASSFCFLLYSAFWWSVIIASVSFLFVLLWWNSWIKRSQQARYTKVPPERAWIEIKVMFSCWSPRIIPATIPIGEAKMKKMKVKRDDVSFHFLLWARKVVPTEHATGTLWMTTEIANTAIAPSSLKTPMARPSMKLCKVIATPKATSDWEDTFFY